MAQTPRGGLYGPPSKGHVGGCAIYSETTVQEFQIQRTYHHSRHANTLRPFCHVTTLCSVLVLITLQSARNCPLSYCPKDISSQQTCQHPRTILSCHNSLLSARADHFAVSTELPSQLLSKGHIITADRPTPSDYSVISPHSAQCTVSIRNCHALVPMVFLPLTAVPTTPPSAWS